MKVKKIGERKKKMVPLKSAALKFISAFLRKKDPGELQKKLESDKFWFQKKEHGTQKMFLSKFMLILKNQMAFNAP